MIQQIIITMIKTKDTLPSLKPGVPKMLQNNGVYKINCPRCDLSYVGQTVRHLQQRFKGHVGNKGHLRTHFESCPITFNEDNI